jgi:hypothetical protein
VRYIATAEAERERAGESEHSDQRDIGGGDDRRGDLQLREDHEHDDREDQTRAHRASHTTGGGVAHQPLRKPADRAGECGADHEDQHGADHIGQIVLHVGHEVGQRGDLQRADGGSDRIDDDEPERNRGMKPSSESRAFWMLLAICTAANGIRSSDWCSFTIRCLQL